MTIHALGGLLDVIQKNTFHSYSFQCLCMKNYCTLQLFVYGGSTILLGSGAAIYRSVDSLEDVRQVGLVRFGRAACAVAKIVVDYKSSLRGLSDPSEEYNAAIKKCHKRSAVELLELACANGGVFIKVGQHLSALEYLIPAEYTSTLSVLTSKAPEASLEDVVYVIESELGKKVDEVFSQFSEKPIGAASLAQVHIARLKENNEKVAVKVQHRRVYKNSRTDINTMEFLVKVADKLFPEFKLMWLVEEVKKNLPQELNFILEAKNADRLAEMFKHLKFLKVPKMYYEYSTPRLLTMEFCEGEHIDDIDYMIKNNIDRHDVCRKMGRLYSEMIFLNGYLHSDPHPGNVLVNKKENGEVEIVLLDHGLYLDIDDRFRGLYADLWLALLAPDPDKLRSVAAEMGVGELYGLFACIVARRSWKAVSQGIKNKKMDTDEKDELRLYAASLIPQISEVLHRMPRQMLLILKTNDLLRNLEHVLGTENRADAHIEMSRCVVRTHYELKLKKPDRTIWETLRIRLRLLWALFKIQSYEWFLITLDTFPFRYFLL
ncbi:ABC1 family protein [Ancylostoma ceylanicum]|uniref:ABC1 family protein n=1 Tax=Ancylostoma ceylanicum TaxID=53326 RepID=A0A0D6LU62_9BILA|nr:ABC1 family protein [Ancylostoma ceylanicum]